MLYRGSLRDTGTAGRRVLIGLCGVMAATVLAGCGGADPASPPAAVSGEGPSGTLRFGTNQRLDDWETITKQNATYTALVYEGLLSLAKDGFTIAPQLATGWKESGREVTFTLREESSSTTVRHSTRTPWSRTWSGSGAHPARTEGISKRSPA